MTKLKNLNFDQTQKYILKMSNFLKLKKVNCEEEEKTQKIRLLQISKTEVGTTLKVFKCDKTHNLNCYKPRNSETIKVKPSKL